MNYKKIYSLSLAIALLLTACSHDALQDLTPGIDEACPLVVYASISGKGNATTRVTITDYDDRWSYKEFTADDAMGFYSSGGNFNEDGGHGAFTNKKLIYDGSSFKDAGGAEFSPVHMKDSEIFMYYPYEEEMEEPGLALRRKKEKDDTLRCVDFLSSSSLSVLGGKDKVALGGTFIHTFSELIVMRGEGFDNPPKGKERITAVLSDPYTHVKTHVSEEGSWSCTPELCFNEKYAKEIWKGKDDEELSVDSLKILARRWDAWQGKNYGITNEDTVGRPAWYVIVPTLANSRSTVEYIELYDNEGNLLQIKSLPLSGGNSKKVDPEWRYPIEIIMKEMVPTINPFPIIPWNGDVNLTDERKRGIKDGAEFAGWVAAYNVYLAEPNDDKINELLKYGDMYVDKDGNNRSWHFYVLSDLDLSNSEGEFVIPELKGDTLDGISTTFKNGKFKNHTLTGLSKTFIGTLSEGASVQNFDFIEPNIIITDESATDPIGIIAKNMEDASVINCNIEDGTLVYPNGPAGIVAGSMTGGLVKDCTLQVFFIRDGTASGEAENLIGTNPIGYATFTNNKVLIIDKDKDND